MTVANAISEQSWTTDGVTASFDFTYPVLAVTDLVVSLDGAAMTLGVDYTATLLSGGASGARIVFLSAPAAAKTLFMLRSPPVSQEVGFVAGQKIYEDTIGDLFDKLTMLVARLARRALLLDDKDPTTTPLVMPTKATRASGVLSFDSSGVAAITPLAQLYAMASVSTRFLGAWSGATAYVAGDAVSYNGSSYRALVDNTNVTPGTDASKWFVLASKGAAGPTGATGATFGAAGTAVVDFGAFPGTDIASVAVADASAIVGSVYVATVAVAASADHSADEHIVEEIEIRVGAVTAGVGFMLYARGINSQLYGKWNVNWIRR